MFKGLVKFRDFSLIFILTSLSFGIDYLAYLSFNLGDDFSEGVFWLLLRPIVYIAMIFLILNVQFGIECKLKRDARAGKGDEYDFRFGTLPPIIAHYFVPSVIRFVTELLPVSILFFIVISNDSVFYDLFLTAIVPLAFFVIAVGVLQKYLAVRASTRNKDYTSLISESNAAYSAVRQLSSHKLGFLDAKVDVLAAKFISASTLSVGFSQSMRAQLEILGFFIIYLIGDALSIQVSQGYLVYRFATTSLLLSQALSSIVNYRSYWLYIK